MAKKTLCIVCSLLLMLMAVSAQAVTVSLNYEEYYRDMKAAFEIQDYEEARRLIEEHELADKNIMDSMYYYMYIQAQDALKAEKYEDAVQYLSVLKLRSFSDSEIWLMWAQACQSQAQGQYESAQLQFAQIAASGNQRLAAPAIERMQACRAAAIESQALANALEQQATYEEAMSLYLTACQNGDISTMKQAQQIFAGLADYSNSKDMLSICALWIADASRTLVVDVKSIQETQATVTVADSKPDSDDQQYTLSLAPAGFPTAAQQKSVKTGDTLDQLIPGTTYHLEVNHKTKNIRAEMDFTTKSAAAVSPELCQQVDAQLLSVSRRALTRYGLDELLNNPKYFSDSFFVSWGLSGIDMLQATLVQQDQVYVCAISLNHSYGDQPVKVQWCFRSSAGPVLMTPAEEMVMQGTLCVSLDDILAADFAESHVWSAHSIEAELYVDGKLAATGIYQVKVANQEAEK